MNNYTELIKAMAEAFMTAVRVLETDNERLKGENELLRLEIREMQERTDVYWDPKEGWDV